MRVRLVTAEESRQPEEGQGCCASAAHCSDDSGVLDCGSLLGTTLALSFAVGRAIIRIDNRIDLPPPFIDQDGEQVMSYRIKGAGVAHAHVGAYRVLRVVVLAAVVAFALLFIAYAALNVASLFWWSLA